MLATDLLMALRNLAQHTRRNLLLGGAIATVTALLVILDGVTHGIRATMLESSTTLMTGHVNVAGFYKLSAGMVTPFLVDYERVMPIVRSVPGLDFATVRGRGYAKAVSATASMDLIVGGVDVGREPGLQRVISTEEGSLAELARPGTILLFADQAKRLGVGVGDDLTLSAPTGRGINNTADVRVAVIARNIGLLSSFSAFIPNDTLRALYQIRPGTTGAIHVYLTDPAKSAAVAVLLRAKLAAAGLTVLEPDPSPYWQKLLTKLRAQNWTGQRVDVTTWEDEMSFMAWILSAFAALSGLLIGILMAIVIVGLMNTMWIAIRERTREIGTMRAIGMQRRRVGWLFVLEAGLLALLGTLVGACAGGLVALGVNALHPRVPEAVQVFLMSQSLTLAVQPRDVVVSVLAVTAATTLTALLPAVRAARLRPITAMHHVG